MAKIRIKKIEDTITEVSKSGVLNSNFKKQLRLKDNIPGKYFQTNYISIGEKSYSGNDYYNDNDTFIFERNSEKSNFLGLPAIPLESNPDNFLLTTDYHFIENNIVSLAEEESINSKHLTYNSVIQSPNKLSLADEDFKSTGDFSSEILKEIDQNLTVEVFTPFNDEYSSLYEGMSNEAILETIDEEIKENYHIGNQKIINIELDFSNATDGLLLNTLFVTRSPDETTLIDSLYDKKISNNQYTFSQGISSNKFAITAHFLPNIFWNEKEKRWEYNSQSDLLHINSNLLSQNEVIFPNSITGNYSKDVNNIDLDLTGDDTNKHTLDFITRYLESAPVTNIISNIENTPNLITNTYGFPYSEKWKPTEDHLINLEKYISREFLLEKVSIEGNTSVRAEYPSKSGNLFIGSSFDEEFLVNSLTQDSKEIVTGLNFYLLKSSNRQNKNNYTHIQGYRKFNSSFLNYRDLNDQTNSIDKSLSDIKSNYSFDTLKGEILPIVPSKINDDNIEFEGIKSTLTKNLNILSNNELKIIDQNKFFFLNNENDITSVGEYKKQEDYKNSISVSTDINDSAGKEDLYFFENNKVKSSNEFDLIFNTSKIFLSKTSDSTIKEDRFENADVETKENLYIDVKEKDFKVIDTCINYNNEEHVIENNFNVFSNLKKVETNAEEPFSASVELDLSYFNAIFGEEATEADVLSNLSDFGTDVLYFSSYSNSDKIQFIEPDITLFKTLNSNSGINISFIPESFETQGFENEHYFAKVVDTVQSLTTEFYKYFIIVSESNNTVYLNTTALRNNKIVNKLIDFYEENISISDQVMTDLISSLNNPDLLTSSTDFSYYKLSMLDKKRLFISAIKLSILLSPSQRISKINESFSDNIFNLNCEFKTINNDIYNNYDKNYLVNKTYFSNISELTVLQHTFVNLYSNFFTSLHENSNSQNVEFLASQRDTSYSVVNSLYSPETVFENLHEESIALFEGKFISNDNSHFCKKNSIDNVHTTSSGKILNASFDRQKSLYVLKPSESIVFGVNSFHGFNKQASFASLHKKLNIKLYGREIKPISKNDSNFSTSVKKTFHGNDCLKIENEYTKKTNASYKNNTENQIKIIDTIQPDPISLVSFIGKNFSSNRTCIVDKIINKEVKKIILSDKPVKIIEEDVISDWHVKYYSNMYKDDISNSKKQFLKTKFRDDYFIYYDSEGITSSYFSHKEALSLRRNIYNGIGDVFIGFDDNNINKASSYINKDLKLFSNHEDNDSLLNFSIRDFFINSNSLIRDDQDTVYELKYNGISPVKSNEIDFLDLSYNIRTSKTDLYNSIELDLQNTERFASSIQYLRVPEMLSFSKYSLKMPYKNRDKFSVNKTYETWCLVHQIQGAKKIVDNKLIDLIISKGNFNTRWSSNGYILLLDNNTVSYKYEILGDITFENFPFMAIYTVDDVLILVTPVEKNYLLPVEYSYSSGCDFSVLNSYETSDNVLSNNNFMNILHETDSEIESFIDKILNPDPSILNNYAPILDSNGSAGSEYFIRSGSVTIIFSDFYLHGDESNKSKGIVYSKNDVTLSKNEFITKNYSSLIDKKYIKDESLLEYLSSKEFTDNPSIENSFLNQKIYQTRLYKKIGNNFVKTNIEVLYGIKNINDVNLNIDNDQFKNLNILGIKSYNPVNNRRLIHYLDNFACINSEDTLRIYESTSEKVSNNSQGLISKNYFEINLSESTVDFNDSLSDVIISSSGSLPLLTKTFLGYSNIDNYVFPGKPIASLADNQEVNKSKLFFFGYRNNKDFKFPNDKIDGFRYGIMGHDSQSEKYEFNFKNSFGNFKDMSYYTKNYARIILKNNNLLEQYCVEKKYINEYYQYIDESVAKNRETFVGTNTDLYSRHFYPYIESTDNSDLTYLYQV